MYFSSFNKALAITLALATSFYALKIALQNVQKDALLILF